MNREQITAAEALVRELERENAALRSELAEAKHALVRRQNAYSRLSHFHERLKANRGLMPTKAFMRIVNALHSDRRASITSQELDAALQLLLAYRPHVEVKVAAAQRPRASLRRDKPSSDATSAVAG
jgi:hypothetical protein